MESDWNITITNLEVSDRILNTRSVQTFNALKMT